MTLSFLGGINNNCSSQSFDTSSGSGLGPQPVEELVTRMSEEAGAETVGSDGGHGGGQQAAAAAALQQLIKTESSASSEPTGPPPSLIPLAGRDAIAAAEKQQVQTAMAMAAIYSQNPLWQAALARQQLQQQQQQQLGQTAAAAAAAAALSQLPGRPPPPALGAFGLPGLAGLLAPAVTSAGAGALGGLLPDSGPNRTDLFRDYLNKLAQSQQQQQSSLTSPTSLPQYLSSAVSTSNLLKADDIKTENPLPASLRPGRPSTSSNRRSSSPGSVSNDRNFLARDGAAPFSPYFNLQRSLTSPAEVGKTINRSPPSGRGRNGNSTGRDKVFTCGVCNRSFGYKHVLQNHERTHTGEKPFECKECHKRFTRDHHLKTHMRLHTGEKPYSCPHCDRQFVQVANLRRHVRVHTGERPYKCELCPSDFSDSNQLKAHMLMHKGKTGPTFNSLKEELLFRHQMAAGFPLPQYPPAPSLASLTGAQQAALQQSAADLQQQQHEMTSSHASLSPDSKETTGSAGDSPGHNENLSDTNSEKRRSRKQKPRKMIFGENEREENTETEEDGSSSRDRSPRERHVSSSSYNRDEQQEPEDLTIRRDKEEGFLAYRASTAISEFAMKRQAADNDSETENGYTATFNATNRNAKPARNRSEGSEGSLSASDPLSAHSTPNEKFRSDDMEDDKDEDDRGVSPPMSHPAMYNQLFGAPAAIQLGLSGAAVPLTRDYMDKESEIMAMVAQHKEISQQ